jgi:hypothetical protein
MPGPNNKHQRLCLRNPDVHKAVRAALDDGTGRIIAREDYGAFHPRWLPGESVLTQALGGWAEVAKHFDLIYSLARRDRTLPTRPGKRKQIRWEKIVAAMAAELDAVAEVATANRYVCEGLPVCRYRVEGNAIYFMVR